MIQTLLVGGWTEPRGSRPFFGSLLLGTLDEQHELRFIGRVASGFTDAQLGLVWKQLHSLKTKSSPFAVNPQTAARARWVKPKLAVRVEFSGWTREGRLRHPVFAGLDPSFARATEGRPSAKATVARNGKRERTHTNRRSIASVAARRD